jgi:hypothetical protein
MDTPLSPDEVPSIVVSRAGGRCDVVYLNDGHRPIALNRCRPAIAGAFAQRTVIHVVYWEDLAEPKYSRINTSLRAEPSTTFGF